MFTEERFTGEGYDREAELLPDVSPEILPGIMSRAGLDAEVYLSMLHAKNPDAIPADPADDAVLGYAMAFDADKLKQDHELMSTQEKEVYETAFRRRFAEGFKKENIH